MLDGNGRRQAFDMVHIGLLHHLKELACVGGQRFDIAPLALGIDRVEGEAGLTGPGQARYHRQGVPRDVYVHALEVVLARTSHLDISRLGHWSSVALRHSGAGRECESEDCKRKVNISLLTNCLWIEVWMVSGSGASAHSRLAKPSFLRCAACLHEMLRCAG